MSSSTAPAPVDDETFHVVFPLWAPVGGVIKILDYLHHTLDAGFSRAVAWGPPLPGAEAPIRHHAAWVRAHQDQRIEFRLLKDLALPRSPWVLFSEPSQHPDIEQATPTGSDPRRTIHLVQNTRHSNPEWHLGFPYLLLHRPITRIHVTHEVAEAIAPVANTHLPSWTIVEGHGWEYFRALHDPEREGPLRVGYTTWKSDLGDRVAAEFVDDDRVAFDALRGPATWADIRDLYHRSDVWLSAPGPEEGFYLPGLEAMAADLVVISALVGGNRAYLEPDGNCLAPPFEDHVAHADAIRSLLTDPTLSPRLRTAGRATLERHTLEREGREFAAVVAELRNLTK